MLNTKQTQFVEHAYAMFNKKELTVEQLKKANVKFGCKYAPQSVSYTHLTLPTIRSV